MISAFSAAAAVLLVVSGLAKLRAPEPAAGMIGDLIGSVTVARLRRIARVTVLVRLGGSAEMLVGALLLIRGGRLAAVLLAASYFVFTVVALRLMSQGLMSRSLMSRSLMSRSLMSRRLTSLASVSANRPSCGCFGQTDSPIGVAHVALNLVGLGAGIAAALDPLTSGAGLFTHGSLANAVLCGQVLLLAWLGYLTITALPVLGSARRLLRPRTPSLEGTR